MDSVSCSHSRILRILTFVSDTLFFPPFLYGFHHTADSVDESIRVTSFFPRLKVCMAILVMSGVTAGLPTPPTVLVGLNRFDYGSSDSYYLSEALGDLKRVGGLNIRKALGTDKNIQIFPWDTTPPRCPSIKDSIARGQQNNCPPLPFHLSGGVDIMKNRCGSDLTLAQGLLESLALMLRGKPGGGKRPYVLILLPGLDSAMFCAKAVSASHPSCRSAVDGFRVLAVPKGYQGRIFLRHARHPFRTRRGPLHPRSRRNHPPHPRRHPRHLSPYMRYYSS